MKMTRNFFETGPLKSQINLIKFMKIKVEIYDFKLLYL